MKARRETSGRTRDCCCKRLGDVEVEGCSSRSHEGGTPRAAGFGQAFGGLLGWRERSRDVVAGGVDSAFAGDCDLGGSGRWERRQERASRGSW